MTTPSGTISLNNVNVELGLSGTTTISMNQTNVRTLAGVPSGAISMQNLQNKSNRVSISYTFSSNTANASLNLSSLGGYSAGKTDFTVTVGSGIWVYSTSTGGYALNLTGATTGDTVTLVNNGFIAGQGANGTAGTYSSGASGGPALNIGIGTNITINNTNASAYIGGGGGAGGASNAYNNFVGSGGGAGGGNGGRNYGPTVSGGNPGSAGNNGTDAYYSGGGGGRIFPGVGGAGGGGAGYYGFGGGAGGGGAYGNGFAKNGPSKTGGGGGWGASGGTGYTEGSSGSGGAGGSGNSPGGSGTPTGYLAYGGGAGGKAVNLNGKTVTWVSGNTTRVYGAIS